MQIHKIIQSAIRNFSRRLLHPKNLEHNYG